MSLLDIKIIASALLTICVIGLIIGFKRSREDDVRWMVKEFERVFNRAKRRGVHTPHYLGSFFFTAGFLLKEIDLNAYELILVKLNEKEGK